MCVLIPEDNLLENEVGELSEVATILFQSYSNPWENVSLFLFQKEG